MKVYRDKRGNLQRLVLPRPGADGRILVAIPDYDLTGCAGAVPVFSRMLKAGLPYRNTGILWRDAAARSLEP